MEERQGWTFPQIAKEGRKEGGKGQIKASHLSFSFVKNVFSRRDGLLLIGWKSTQSLAALGPIYMPHHLRLANVPNRLFYRWSNYHRTTKRTTFKMCFNIL